MKQESLQKFTINEIMKIKKITYDDLNKLSKTDKDKLASCYNEKLTKVKGTERDELIKQVWDILPEDSRNALWESNHSVITNKLHFTIKNNGYIPSVGELSRATNLSRQTISKHLKKYKESFIYSSYKESIQILHSNVLQIVYQLAMNGDLKACKLYFEIIGEINRNTKSTYIDKQQNNTLNNFNSIKEI